MSVDYQHYSIMVLDVVAFGQRDDRFQQRIRRGLIELVSAAFTESNLVLGDMVVEDRGDGMAILVPATTSKMKLFDPLLDRVEIGLRQHNEAVSERGRIRLRIALHAGEIAKDGNGWVGSDLNTAFRLVDSQPIRTVLDEHQDVQLAVIVSDSIHQHVIRHGHGAVRPSDYVRVRVTVKELAVNAWLRVTGVPATPGVADAPRVDAPRPADGGGATFHGQINVNGDFVGRDKHVGWF